eukprot:Nk52_evm12s210 gene=Nk52_evmTU12s210
MSASSPQHSHTSNHHTQQCHSPHSSSSCSSPPPLSVKVERVGPYRLGKTLGHGTTGRVKLGTRVVEEVPGAEKMQQQHVAVKIIDKTQLQLNPTLKKKTEREISIMKLIEHPNVLGLYDVYESPHHLFLVLEYIEGGELFDYLVKKGRLEAKEALFFFVQIISAVDFCHNYCVYHRDLKPENLLLDRDKNIKIADFGFASFQAARSAMLDTSCGSPHYASPEVIRGEKYRGSAADVWSCGVILYALLTGSLPFDDDNVHRLLRKVKSGVYSVPAYVPAECQDLLKKMLTVNPKERYTLEQVKKHSWLVKNNVKLEKSVDMYEHTRSLLFEEDLSCLDEDVIRSMECLGCFADEDSIYEELSKSGENIVKSIYCLLMDRKRRNPSTVDDEVGALDADNADAPRKRTDSMYFDSPTAGNANTSYVHGGGSVNATEGSPRSKLLGKKSGKSAEGGSVLIANAKRQSSSGRNSRPISGGDPSCRDSTGSQCSGKSTASPPSSPLSKSWLNDALSSFAKFSPRFHRRKSRTDVNEAGVNAEDPVAFSSSPKKSWFSDFFSGGSSSSQKSSGKETDGHRNQNPLPQGYIDETFFNSNREVLDIYEEMRSIFNTLKVKYQSSRFGAYKCKFEYTSNDNGDDDSGNIQNSSSSVNSSRSRRLAVKFRADIIPCPEKKSNRVFLSLQHGEKKIFRDLSDKIMIRFQE